MHTPMEQTRKFSSERDPIVSPNVSQCTSDSVYFWNFVERKKKQNCNISKEPLDLDDLLPALGEFGCYQKLLLWLVCLPACIPCGFCAFNQLFMADAPDNYWCKVPQLNEFNLTDEQVRHLAIPSIEVNCAIKSNDLSMK